MNKELNKLTAEAETGLKETLNDMFVNDIKKSNETIEKNIEDKVGNYSEKLANAYKEFKDIIADLKIVISTQDNNANNSNTKLDKIISILTNLNSNVDIKISKLMENDKFKNLDELSKIKDIIEGEKDSNDSTIDKILEKIASTNKILIFNFIINIILTVSVIYLLVTR